PSTRSSSITTSWPFVISSATPMSQQPRFTRKPQLPDSRPWSRPFPSHQDVGPVSRSCATSSLTNSSATHIRPRLPEIPAVPQTEGHHNEQDPYPLPGEVQMRTHRQTRPVQSSTLPSSAGGPIRLLRHKGREGRRRHGLPTLFYRVSRTRPRRLPQPAHARYRSNRRRTPQ